LSDHLEPGEDRENFCGVKLSDGEHSDPGINLSDIEKEKKEHKEKEDKEKEHKDKEHKEKEDSA